MRAADEAENHCESISSYQLGDFIDRERLTMAWAEGDGAQSVPGLLLDLW